MPYAAFVRHAAFVRPAAAPPCASLLGVMAR